MINDRDAESFSPRCVCQPVLDVKIILQVNVPKTCAVTFFVQPQVKKVRRPVKLINHEGIPSELAHAAVCREVGCDCVARLGSN